jgi:hypothetical protein
MSSPLAIAAVTAVLKDLLNNGVIDRDLSGAVGGNVNVTALPPDRIDTGTQEKNQLNLFLYQVTPNLGWRNVGLPSRDGNGATIANAPLALDLHYLLTAYGDKELNAELLLGYAMHLLHENPVMRRQDIRTSLAAAPLPAPVNGSLLPPGFRNSAAADLADQVELIKITPQYLSNEELSKLWTAFQGHYRMGAAYLVSVVLIEGQRPTRAAVPVHDRRLHVLPFQQATIDSVVPPVLHVGDALTINGQNLQASGLRASFGTVTANPIRAGNAQMVVAVPSGLSSGVNTVQVVQDFDFKTPVEPHRGFASNVAPFMLAPRITTQPALPGTPLVANRGAPFGLDFEPPVGRAQDVRLLIGNLSLRLAPRDPGGPPTATHLDFPIPADFPVGTYLLRVQVDGAQSLLDVDTSDPNNPHYSGPRVQVQ